MTIWMFRRAGQYPNGCVEMMKDGRLEIQYSPERNPFEDRLFSISRRDARLLAKRITQCLEATK